MAASVPNLFTIGVCTRWLLAIGVSVFPKDSWYLETWVLDIVPGIGIRVIVPFGEVDMRLEVDFNL